MLVSLTVGKVDAGVAVLLTDDKRLIEFPSILLPPNISSGSIVDINVSRNLSSEAKSQSSFAALQNSIYTTFGQRSPSPPILRCRNATQTSVVLEWDPISLATAELRSLSLYRDGSKAGTIPKPLEQTATKISGLAIDTEYIFYLVLKTSAGTYPSEKLAVTTHKMTDLSGITVSPGILPGPLRESLETAVDRIGAKLIEGVRLDTTHFVCIEGKGQSWEKAVEQNIPVVRPEWVEGCEREGRLVPVKGYYLNADPRLRQVGQGAGLQQQQQQSQSSDGRPSGQMSPTRTRAAPGSSSQQSLPTSAAASAAPETPTTTQQNGAQATPSASTADVRSADEDDDDQGESDKPEPKTTHGEPKVRRPEQDDTAARSEENVSSVESPTKESPRAQEEGKQNEGARTPGNEGFSDVAL
ncbi:MAG: Translation initiation factor 1A [Chaenotheca gracillima]|nr:MAG: Translation initiation factor 1A [Chaenotheca gracillima]